MRVILRNVLWPEARMLLQSGTKGYYIERNGYITVVLAEAGVECEFPGEAEFDALPPDFRMTFDRGAEAEFHSKYASSLIRSAELSDPSTR